MEWNNDTAYVALSSGTPEERAEAIKYLGENAYAPAVPMLAELLENGDPGTRYLAAMALGKIGDEAESAVNSLLIALRFDDMYLRVAVTGTLIAIGRPAVAGLVRALFDNNAAVRRAAAKALGKIGDRDTIKPLTVALKDGDAGVRKFAEEAINRLQTA